jgi:hypothetical protein
LLLIIPFMRLGERVLGVTPQPLTIEAGMAILADGAIQAIVTLWDAIVHAASGLDPYRTCRDLCTLPAADSGSRTRIGATPRRTHPNMNKLQLQSRLNRWLEQDRIPDRLIRRRIRELLAQRLREEDKGTPEAQQAHLMQMIARLRESPIAVHTDKANEQHYEVPRRSTCRCSAGTSSTAVAASTTSPLNAPRKTSTRPKIACWS